MVVRVGAELLAEGDVDQVRIAHVSEEEGAHRDAVLVGELAPAEDRVGLGHGPPLDILAGEDVADEPLRLLRHRTQRAIATTCEQGVRSAQERERSTRAVSCTGRTGDGAARASGGQRAVVEGSGQRAAGIGGQRKSSGRQAASRSKGQRRHLTWQVPWREL